MYRLYLIILYLFIAVGAYSASPDEFKSLQFKKPGAKRVFILTSEKLSSFYSVQQAIIDELEGKYEVLSYNLEGNDGFAGRIPALLKAKKPHLIVCIGSMSLRSIAGKITDIPILFGMVINYRKLRVERYKNIAGVSLIVPPESVFYNLKNIIHDFSKVGVIASKEYQKYFLKNKRLESLGVDLLVETANTPAEIAQSYAKISGKVEVLWMVPDVRIITRKSFLDLASKTLKDKKIFIVFSENFVKAGGSFSVSPNYSTIGSQLAVMAQRILDDNTAPPVIGIVPVIGTLVAINKGILKKIGIIFKEGSLDNVDIIVE
ncbi:MAG: hypothetical protein GY754_14990 [bacterium]|nr:hypothetical protein [bacterium]